ncbi:MAG: twitch domain-containing radical SAM protein [Bdellovibrionales bacterium]|nr:twitch domain-containing radical SAM protein [Bdellovibrionales bacterium]
MSDNEIMKRYFSFRDDVLNKVSPTFCSAKWLQSSIYLWNGHTHSCHHPVQHKVSLEDIKKNPKALHNSPKKIQARQEMLNGVQTSECNYCWNIENLADDHLSDRTYKSFDEWSKPSIPEVIKDGLGENINPTYLEIGFENSCNLKCSYCSPDVSSRWMEEIQSKGPYTLSQYNMHDLDYLKQIGKFPIHRDDPNPYADAFWEWWPDLYKSLKVFRITGGEPLLSRHVWKVLDYIAENPREDLDFAINTNLCVPQKQIEKLVEFANKTHKKIKSFNIYTSLESTGPQAEYVRFGLNYNTFLQNVNFVLSNTPDEVRVNFMTTINILSTSSFSNFLQDILELRAKYSSNKEEHRFNLNRVPLMFSYLRWPHFLSIKNLPLELKSKFSQEWRNFVKNNLFGVSSKNTMGLFYQEEEDQMARLCDFMLTNEDNLKLNMIDFYLFHQQYDERRNVKFKEVFPELAEFYDECKNAWSSK